MPNKKYRVYLHEKFIDEDLWHAKGPLYEDIGKAKEACDALITEDPTSFAVVVVENESSDG